MLAAHQTAGRGQQSNSWLSKAGENLTCSFILYPRHSKPEQAFLLNMAIALAVSDTVVAQTTGFCDAPTRIKWPNDILCADQKVAGILVENIWQGQRWDACVAGIGLNLNQQHFGEVEGASSLGMLCRQLFDINQVLSALQQAVKVRYRQWEQTPETVYHDYNAMLWRRGLQSDFQSEGGETVPLILESVDRLGCACVLDAEGKRASFRHGEIRQLR